VLKFFGVGVHFVFEFGSITGRVEPIVLHKRVDVALVQKLRDLVFVTLLKHTLKFLVGRYFLLRKTEQVVCGAHRYN
jgi:hypothetical protein